LISFGLGRQYAVVALVVAAGLVAATVLAFITQPDFARIERYALVYESGSRFDSTLPVGAEENPQALYLPFHGGSLVARLDGSNLVPIRLGRPGDVDRYRSGSLFALPGDSGRPAQLQVAAPNDRLPAGLGTIYRGPQRSLEEFDKSLTKAIGRINLIMPLAVSLCLILALLMVFLSGAPARYAYMAGLFAASAMIEFDHRLAIAGLGLRQFESYIGIAYCSFVLLSISEWWERPDRERRRILIGMLVIATLVGAGDLVFGMNAPQTRILRQAAFIGPLLVATIYWSVQARRGFRGASLEALIALACAGLGFIAAMLNLVRLYVVLEPASLALVLFETKILGGLSLLTLCSAALIHEYRYYAARRGQAGVLDRIVSGANLSVDNQARALKHQIESRAVSEERIRLTRDLHDGLSGQLLSLLLKARSGEIAPAEVARDVERSLADLRLIAAALEDGERGFAGALETFRMRATEHTRAAGMRIEWHEDRGLAALELDPRHQLDLLRALQEALTNAVRHSQGSLITIALKLHDGSLEAEVIDNGIGLNGKAPLGSGGAGLRNIRQRLANLGGTSSWERPT
jgi:signal transduction histidine kinase